MIHLSSVGDNHRYESSNNNSNNKQNTSPDGCMQ